MLPILGVGTSSLCLQAWAAQSRAPLSIPRCHIGCPSLPSPSSGPSGTEPLSPAHLSCSCLERVPRAGHGWEGVWLNKSQRGHTHQGLGPLPHGPALRCASHLGLCPRRLAHQYHCHRHRVPCGQGRAGQRRAVFGDSPTPWKSGGHQRDKASPGPWTIPPLTLP